MSEKSVFISIEQIWSVSRTGSKGFQKWTETSLFKIVSIYLPNIAFVFALQEELICEIMPNLLSEVDMRQNLFFFFEINNCENKIYKFPGLLDITIGEFKLQNDYNKGLVSCTISFIAII